MHYYNASKLKAGYFGLKSHLG